MPIRHVVWDWNGTLFDDVDAAVATINAVLGEYGLPALADVEAYRGVFCFPISTYYERIGLGPATGHFDAAAHRYMAVWEELVGGAGLRDGAREALVGVRARGIGQAVVSASRAENLAAQMAPFGLDAHLDAALGIGDIYAASKLHVAREWLDRLAADGIAAGEVLFVGDTAHDVEIAAELGARSTLLAGGHADAAEVAAAAEAATDAPVRVLGGPADVLTLLDETNGAGAEVGTDTHDGTDIHDGTGRERACAE